MPQTILIIDDFQSLHGLVKTHLGTDDFAFESALTGKEGLALAAMSRPDLILLDVDLLDMDGFAVCRCLKNDPVTARIPVIFLTAASAAEQKVCGLEMQAADYITKPFDPEEMAYRVRAALRTKRLLDLLPADVAKTAPVPTHAHAPNARLTFAQLAAVRMENPWNRKPPPKVNPANQPLANHNPA